MGFGGQAKKTVGFFSLLIFLKTSKLYLDWLISFAIIDREETAKKKKKHLIRTNLMSHTPNPTYIAALVKIGEFIF